MSNSIITCFVSSSGNTSPIFIIDSGCSKPMCKDLSAFTNLIPDKTPVQLADGSITYTEGIGSIGDFHNIYYVPALQYNLLSVAYLNDLSFSVTFTTDKNVILTDTRGNSHLLGSMHHDTGLFCTIPNYFQPSIRYSNGEYSLISSTRSQRYLHQLWHNRLCHINDEYINLAVRQNLVTGVPIDDATHRDFCESCAMAKATRVSSSYTPGSRHKRRRKGGKRAASPPTAHTVDKPIDLTSLIDDLALAPLQKFAVDIKGPLPASINNNKYALIFTCMRTRYRFAYFLKEKSQTHTFVRSLISHVRSLKKNIEFLQFDEEQLTQEQLASDHPQLKELLETSRITPSFSALKSDNGGEFLNGEMQQLMEEFDINHQTTSPYTPHQNGVAERSNRTIFELAAALLHTSNCPTRLWPYAVRQVVYTLNRMPNKRLNLASSPYIEVHKAIPDLSHLRVFGCRTYVTLDPSQQPSIGLKAVKGIFIGYNDPQNLSYLVYYKNKVLRTGHGQFNEDMASQHILQAPNTLETDINDLLDHVDNPNIVSDDNPFSMTPSYFLDYDTHRYYGDTQATPTDPSLVPSGTALADRPSDNTRSHSRTTPTTAPPAALYSHLSKISLEDAIGAITSGKHYDPSYEDLDKPSFHLMACGILTEEDAAIAHDSHLWEAAMQEEINKLQGINTWSVVHQLPEGRKPLKYKWVLKNKNDIFGKYIYKARLTIKGCGQKYGFDFDETFSPVAQTSAIRLILSLATAQGMTLWQFDVANAFANAELTGDMEIFMEAPTQMNLPSGTYLKLNRALYGLKQASREWNLLLNRTLISLGFKQLISDACLFTIDRNGEQIILAIYVDDIFVCSKSQDNIDWLYTALSGCFKVNATPLSTCLGFNITGSASNNSITINKDDYIKLLVDKYQHLIADIPFRDTPLDPNIKLSRTQCPTSEKEKEKMSQLPFKQLIGALNYLCCTLRADITFATHYLARFMDNPAPLHWQQLLLVLAYLRDHPQSYITYSGNTIKYFEIDGITYPMLPNTLYCYVDADFASTDVDSRKSVTGYAIYFNGGLISWKSGLQKTVSASSTEAEYKAMHEASKEVIWLMNILAELGHTHLGSAYMFEDNTSTIRVSENPVSSSNLKHIDTIYHQVREFISQGKITVYHIPTHQQLADILTKPLSATAHNALASGLMYIPTAATLMTLSASIMHQIQYYY